MSSVSCAAWVALHDVLFAFWLAMLLYALVSWVPSFQGRWSYYLARIVEPVLLPVRRIIPPMGGLDLSFLVVILIVGYLWRSTPSNMTACYFANGL